MPIYFKFTDPTTEQAIPLDVIDNEICKDFDEPCLDHSYSIMFQLITGIGDYATASGVFSMAAFDEAIEKCSIDADRRWKILKFIRGKYNYSSWR